MRLHFVTVILLASLFFIIGVSMVFADGYKGWSPIKTTGYGVISNYQGIDVPPGQEVVVTAGTKNLSITGIVFRWHDPDDNVVWEDYIPVQGPLTTPDVPDNVHQEVIDWANDNPNVKYLYAQNTHTPDTIGDWGVQAFFIGDGGKTAAGVEDVIKIRATSFNVIPDLPVVGTAGAVTAMLLGFGLFLRKNKKRI
mgnify:CR=1 FL=1